MFERFDIFPPTFENSCKSRNKIQLTKPSNSESDKESPDPDIAIQNQDFTLKSEVWVPKFNRSRLKSTDIGIFTQINRDAVYRPYQIFLLRYKGLRIYHAC